MSEGILQGLRVLDFTRVLAGPFATRILADFGAEVIKVQSLKTVKDAKYNTTGYFSTWERNKLGITLDLSHPEGKTLALKLVKISDIVIENFTPRVMKNLGLDYKSLKRIRPDLIMISMSGMGQTGPWKDYAAFGETIQALSGVTYLTSFTQNTPLGLGYSYADHIAGLYAALAALIALEYRDSTGQGQYIDLSEYQAMCTLMGPMIMDSIINNNPAVPVGNDPDYSVAAPYGCYRCLGEDQWCVIAISTDEEWQALCCVMGNPSWTKEVTFSTMKQRIKHSKELDKLLEQWTIKHGSEEVMSLLQESGVPVGTVRNARELAEDPQMVARQFFMEAHHPVLGKIKSDSTPVRLERSPAQLWRTAPLLGQDNHYVYHELLDISESEMSRYIKEGVIS